MGCYCKILVALDGSPDAYAALDHAATLACDQHARLVVLMVAPAPKHAVAVGGPVLISDPEAAYAEELREAVNSLPPSVSVESRLTSGKPARRILEVAEECSCDLVVMGFHGHGRWHNALAGSVSGTVLRESTRPVLLIRAGETSPARHEPQPALTGRPDPGPISPPTAPASAAHRSGSTGGG
jgi:nucleotide-binding universal stress UspA family protein